MKKKISGPFYVYKIVVNNHIVYIGSTNNVERRTKEHNRNLKKGKSTKKLYKYLNSLGISEVKLDIIKQFPHRSTSKAYEMFTILSELFVNHNSYLQNSSIDKLYLYPDLILSENSRFR